MALLAAPELIAEAATDLATIRSTLAGAHLMALAPTQALLPAAADEVSASVAHLFSRYGQEYHGLATQAGTYHEQFVQHLTAAAGSYAGAEAINAAALQSVTANAAASVPSLDQLLSNVMPLLWQSVAALYYLLFLLLIPIYIALALYLPFAFVGSLIPAF